MKLREHVAYSRLRKWGHWVRDPNRIAASTGSPFGRLAKDRNAAGSHADGIRYEIIDGVACPPDGGLAREMEFNARSWGHDLRCRETHAAVSNLPLGMRKAIIETYAVGAKEDPRGVTEVARRLGRNLKTVQEALQVAHDRIAREIFGPFQIIEQCEAENPCLDPVKKVA